MRFHWLYGMLMTFSQILSLAYADQYQCPENYAISSEVHILDMDKFTIPVLNEYFAKYLDYQIAGELTVRLTSDHELIDDLKAPRVRVHSADKKPLSEHPKIVGPHACLYKVGGNFFYEYRDMKNRIGWVTIRGENVLSRSFGSNQSHYIGQYWSKRAGEKPYMWSRALVLVIPTLDRIDPKEIVNIAEYYKKIMGCPSDMTIEIFQSFRQCEATQHIAIPSLESIASGALDISKKTDRRVFCFWERGKLILRVYDGIESVLYEFAGKQRK
jgi:hypothetical protein